MNVLIYVKSRAAALEVNLAPMTPAWRSTTLVRRPAAPLLASVVSIGNEAKSGKPVYVKLDELVAIVPGTRGPKSAGF